MFLQEHYLLTSCLYRSCRKQKFPLQILIRTIWRRHGNQRDLDANGIPVVIEATTDRRAALKDARYIVNCVRVGGLEGFETDIEIPLKYGVDQCVGDTLCTGGIMYGQRVIAAMLDFCKDIREVSEPGAGQIFGKF